MYYELIYTRCRADNAAVQNNAKTELKVYSFTKQMKSDNDADLPLLQKVVSEKHFVNQSLKEDSYQYFVPDSGKRFMINFHSFTPSNFIKHALIGDFTEVYPHEFFGDKSIWSAKERGEEHYLKSQLPVTLAIYADTLASQEAITIEQVSSFVHSGREQALKAAVAFLVKQYSEPPENRKYLVIMDKSINNVEMWIAAIEYAFSPRIAATISFATSMESHASENTYAVDLSGTIVDSPNLSDANQKKRFTAMIVGTDGEGANVHFENARWEVIDGKEKKAKFSIDIDDDYFSLISGFDYRHQRFIRQFLQMIDIKSPTNDIFSLYKAYIALDHPVGAKVTADSLSTLLKYQMIKSKYFIDLYSTIKPKMQSFLEESAESALVIMDWLQKASEVLKKGDDISFGDLLNKTFADLIFVKRDEEKFRAFWNDVKASKYAIALAAYMLSPNTFIEYGEYARAFTPSEGIAFALIILECSAVLENLDPEDLTAIADYGLKSSIKDSNEFPRKIYNALEKAFNKDKGKMQNALMSILLDNSSNKDYCEYIINMRVKMDGDLLSSPQIMESFFDELTQGPLQGYYGAALRSVANHIGFNYISKLINLMKKYSQKTFGETERAAFESLDKKLSSLDSAYCNIARVIYTQRPDLAKCPNSAHLYALHIIDYADLVSEEFKRIDRRDFPLIEDNQGFIQDFISSFINRNMDPDTARDVISRLMENKTYFKVLVPSIVKEAISIDGVKFRSLIGLVSQRTGTYVETVLQEELSKFKDKDIKELTGILEKREKEYFKDLMKQSRKPNSGFPKIWPNK